MSWWTGRPRPAAGSCIPGRDPIPLRRPFLVLFISVFAATLGLGIIVPLLPVYATSMGATGVWLGVIFSGYAFSRTIFMPIIGSLSDRRGRKRLILAGLLLYSLISLAYIGAGSVLSLTVVRVLHGLASAMIVPVAMAYVADLSRTGSEGRLMGLFTMSLFLGMGLGPFFGGAILDIAGMDQVFLAMCGLSVFSLFTCMLFLPESRCRVGTPARLIPVLRRPRMQAMFFFRFANAFALAPFLVFFSMIATVRFGLSATEVGLIISTAMLIMAAGQGFFGALADRWSRTFLIGAGSVLAAVPLLAIPYLPDFFLLLGAAAVMGTGNAMSIPAATAEVTADGRATGQGAAMGAFNMAMSLGMLIAPVLFGLVMDRWGLGSVFTIAGVISLGAVAVFLMLARRVS